MISPLVLERYPTHLELCMLWRTWKLVMFDLVIPGVQLFSSAFHKLFVKWLKVNPELENQLAEHVSQLFCLTSISNSRFLQNHISGCCSAAFTLSFFEANTVHVYVWNYTWKCNCMWASLTSVSICCRLSERTRNYHRRFILLPRKLDVAGQTCYLIGTWSFLPWRRLLQTQQIRRGLAPQGLKVWTWMCWWPMLHTLVIWSLMPFQTVH